MPTWAASIIDEDPTRSSGEPSIRAADDGTLYIVAPAGLANPRSLPTPVGSGGNFSWRSDDDGKTWKFLDTTVIGGGDGDVVTAEGDVVYQSGLSLACVTVARSADRGETWVPNPINCSTTPVDDRQWNDVHGDAVYTAFGSIGLDQINVNKSLFTSPLVVSNANVAVSGTDHQWPGVMDVDPTEGVVYQSWQTTGAPNDCDDDTSGCLPADASKDEPDVIKIAALTDSDFAAGPLANPEHIVVASRPFDTFDAFTGLDVSPQGVIHVVWNERHPEVKQTWSMIASSANQGATWTAPKRVNTVATTAFPWVTAGDDGRVMVSYYGTASTGNSPETTVGDWRVYNAFSSDGGATFAETVVTPKPMHSGTVCTSGTGCAAGARDLVDFFETDVTPAGCLVVTYTDNSRDAVVNGIRETNLPERIAFARQSGGPSLLAGRTCGAAAPAAPAPAPTEPGAGPPPTKPTESPRPQPRPGAGGPLPATGADSRLPLVAALVLGSAVVASVRSRAAARRSAPDTTP
ncbi:MAG TPA: sialidase family protein [Mycobacteriales bacterium]|nr:sialidase family protein [Mycobacteriales bacterium]